ncbi:S-adenosyl-L-methionine-dependent methyltransferase [Cryphonectria parasitica EP155]|uniref:S-adenosyl-L-methionine-dependent methyltransferase n=1 Tax=Cryphonectria parasitica (strain ATCC 38755 / EP155) TaxID=660469 RepID=A0A9P4Y3D8_CRYP1|nr:S-adenosyl-L-methionine-dependent methyltransferase [Cryphonectria parasitica EP155]KAF3765764.1 S-adenosyl-L-methionine-dependent methyltransferase [Cryphonectria parasitica EP155]
MKAVSQPLAANMLAKIGLNESTSEPFKLLDHGCGLGVVSRVLKETIPLDVMQRSSVLCGDSSETLVGAVRKRIVTEGWANTEARVLDAQNSGLPAESFTHVVSNICFHLVPDSQAALKDSIRLLAPGGTLAITTWHTANPSWVIHMRDAFDSFPASLLPEDYKSHFPMHMSSWGQWGNVDWLRDTLSDPTLCALEDVRVEVFANSYWIENVDEFMKAHAKMIDLVAGMVLTKESVAKLGGMEGVRGRVREYLEGRFGTKGWTMTGLSILAWGRKPS